MSEGITWINKKLIEEYGKDVSLNLPNYRIVFSTSQREKRYGTFNDYSESGYIYLRTVTETREVPKYNEYPDLWILETIQANLANPELHEKWSYEPLWVFGANNSERQPVWRAVELIVKSHKIIRKMHVVTKAEEVYELNEQLLREKKIFKDMLQNESPYIAGAIHDGEAIVVPHNYVKQE